jgi:ADP-heptose:LPS heptosyltransferase
LALPQRYAVLLPGCSPVKPSKRWPAAHYADLASELQGRGIAVVLAGTHHDEQAIAAVLEQNPDCISIMGKTDFDQIASVFRHATAICGNDTGPVFLAARMQVPTVMVMGSDTEPSMSAPVGRYAGWVRHQQISDITAAEVMAKLLTLGLS